MQQKMIYSKKQATFYDAYPPLVLWQDVLVKFGLTLLYKPREIFWKTYLDKLGLKRSQKVLDVGCGQGIFLARMNKTYGISGYGVDVSKESVRQAVKNFSNQRIKFQLGDACRLPFDDQSFDIVTSFDLLEHIQNQAKAISEIVRVLKPGGKLLIYTLNKNYQYTLDWFWEKLGFDIFTRAAHTKNLFLDPVWLKKILTKNKCKILNFELFDAFFTLGLDESIMAGLLVWKGLGLSENLVVGNLLLRFYANLSKELFPALDFLDKPWYKANKSLSFMVIAEK